MATDYSILLAQYPEVISGDQVYRICHISKRKAKWLLENGYIPCTDTGKKTRRFKIRTVDVIQYLQTIEKHPEKDAPPGIFSSRPKGSAPNRKDVSNRAKSLKAYLIQRWENTPDALTPSDICHLTGYSQQVVRGWIKSGKLKSVRTPRGFLIAKEWLIDLLTTNTFNQDQRFSQKYNELFDQLMGEDQKENKL